MKPLEPPESLHLQAAQGWLELGNHVEVDAELDEIAPELRRRSPSHGGTVWQLQRFLQQAHGLKLEASRPATRVDNELDRYGEYSQGEDGYARR